MENGVMAKELATWRPEPPKCQILDKFYSVKMETVAFALSIFACGVVAASILLLIELAENNRQVCTFNRPDLIMSYAKLSLNFN